MKNVAGALFACALLIVAAPSSAQQAERSIADAASDTVKDAAIAAWQTAQNLSSVALGLIGVDYRYGGNRPETGLDCSGLVRYVFQQVTGIELPRTAKAMSQVGSKVTLQELQPGDIVFFNTRRFAFSHVGIYLGENRFIHAPSHGREVEVAMIDKSFWQSRFNGARRLIGTLPELVPDIVTGAIAMPTEAVVVTNITTIDGAETMP